MPNLAPTICPKCSKPLPVGFKWLGAPVTCRQCLSATVPVMPEGAVYPLSGYELRYGDFEQLLQSNDESVRMFLQHRFGYVNGSGQERARVLNPQREAIDLYWLHERIQDNSTLQRELYDIAMSLWR